MTEASRSPTEHGGAEKRRVLKARHFISDLAGRMEGAERARQVQADLNDAWLRLQLARVMDDPALTHRQQRAYEGLLDEVLEKLASEPRPEHG